MIWCESPADAESRVYSGISVYGMAKGASGKAKGRSLNGGRGRQTRGMGGPRPCHACTADGNHHGERQAAPHGGAGHSDAQGMIHML